MANREEQWLVRAPNGTMSTIVARTAVGALKRWCVQYPRMMSGEVSVKRRGDDTDNWIVYLVDR